MKNYIILLMSLLILATACQKTTYDLIDGQRPEDRVDARIRELRGLLVGAEYGWEARLYTTLMGGGYGFYMKFSDDNMVRMVSDISANTAAEFSTTSFRLDQSMVPSLSFESYTYISRLQDPNPLTLGGIQGNGYGSDIEFEFRDIVADTIKMRGKKWNTELTLIKSTAATQQFFENGNYANNFTNLNSVINQNFMSFGTGISATQLSINTDVTQRTVTMYTFENDRIVSTSIPYLYTPSGITLRTALEYNGRKITHFSSTGSRNFTALTDDGNTIDVDFSNTLQIPLRYSLGTIINNRITVPLNTPARLFGPTYLPLWNNNILRFPFQTLTHVEYSFNANNKLLIATLYLRQGDIIFPLPYNMPYDENNGLLQVRSITPGNANANMPAIVQAVAPILIPLQSSSFSIETIVDPFLGRGALIQSINNPNFWFAGSIN